ncbi:hypothetical protein LR48_Vigan479s000300 [Vigna angularis]|uniref:Uncharacterized protein n=1 Tax=Phaseolus angularis TaxID=3914 RepID=A0A0L9TCY7_PHAAN|nr:hypothetical protein LR48_Vigan479s000300 [Vigna angularis]
MHYKKEGHYRRPEALGNSPKPSIKGNYTVKEPSVNLLSLITKGQKPSVKAFGNYLTWVVIEGKKPSNNIPATMAAYGMSREEDGSKDGEEGSTVLEQTTQSSRVQSNLHGPASSTASRPALSKEMHMMIG